MIVDEFNDLFADCDGDCLGCHHLDYDCEGNEFYWEVYVNDEEGEE